MVGTHLAAVDRIFGAHAFLDKGVAGLALNRIAAERFGNLDRVPGQSWVMNDVGASLLLQKFLGEQADDVIALDEASIFIEEETTIKIAVPGDTQIGAVLPDRIDCGLAIFLQQGIWHTIGEVAIGLMVNLDEFKGQMWFQQVDDGAGTTIARVANNFQRF